MAVTEPSSKSPKQLDRTNLAITFLISGPFRPAAMFDFDRDPPLSLSKTRATSVSHCPGHCNGCIRWAMNRLDVLSS